MRLRCHASVLASVATVLAWPSQSLGAIVVGKTIAGSSLERVHIGESQATVRRTLGAPSHIRQVEEVGIHDYTFLTYRRLGLTVVFHGSAISGRPDPLAIPFRVLEIETTSRRLTAYGLRVGSTLAQVRARGLECVGGPAAGISWRCEKIIGPPFQAGPTPRHSRDTELMFWLSLSNPRVTKITMSEWSPGNALEGAPGFT